MSKVCLVVLALVLALGANGQSGRGKPSLIQLAKQLGLSEFVDRLEANEIDRIINHEGKSLKWL